MLTIELLLSIIVWHKEEDDQHVARLFWIMHIIYPLALLFGSFFILWAFVINPQDLLGT